ncbi:MAG TPA: hypothetical protein VF699_01625 [Caulobacteraceae bacterium]|jgi:hypothetical protein
MGQFITKDYDVKGYLYNFNGDPIEVKVLAFSHGVPSAPDRYLSEMGVSLDGVLPKGNAFYTRLLSSHTLSVICARASGYYPSHYLKSFEMTFAYKDPKGTSSTSYAELHFYETLISDVKAVDARKMNSKPPYPRLDALTMGFGSIKWH